MVTLTLCGLSFFSIAVTIGPIFFMAFLVGLACVIDVFESLVDKSMFFVFNFAGGGSF